MNLQQDIQSRSSSNGYGCQSVNGESMCKSEKKLHSVKTNSSIVTDAGVLAGSEGGGYVSPSCERLVYLTTCLIGQSVEVQVKDGSLYSGIFHAADTEYFGIILKMGHCTRAGHPESRSLVVYSDDTKVPQKTLIIPAKEFVQIYAKGVSVTIDGEGVGAMCP